MGRTLPRPLSVPEYTRMQTVWKSSLRERELSSRDFSTEARLKFYGSKVLGVDGISQLHHMAAGDFMLMARDRWFELHGYPGKCAK